MFFVLLKSRSSLIKLMNFCTQEKKTENENMRKYDNMTRTWFSKEQQHYNSSSFFFHTFADVYCQIQTVFR